jgi:hypothetical protein
MKTVVPLLFIKLVLSRADSNQPLFDKVEALHLKKIIAEGWKYLVPVGLNPTRVQKLLFCS